MTPEERAQELAKSIAMHLFPDAVQKITAAIREAVEEEREACAQVAARWPLRRSDDYTTDEIAAAIRTRANPPDPPRSPPSEADIYMEKAIRHHASRPGPG